jgi:hypothetical protein
MPRRAHAHEEQALQHAEVGALQHAEVGLRGLAVDAHLARQRVVARQRARPGRDETQERPHRRRVEHTRSVSHIALDDRRHVALEEPPPRRRAARTRLREAARQQPLRVLPAAHRRIPDRRDLPIEESPEEVLWAPLHLALGQRPERQVVGAPRQRIRHRRDAPQVR